MKKIVFAKHLIKLNQFNKMNNYYFFWNGPFSQWYWCSFQVAGIKFKQYMMYKKAELFNDHAIKKEIY